MCVLQKWPKVLNNLKTLFFDGNFDVLNVVITTPIRDFQKANLGGIECSTTWFKHIFKIGSQFVQI